MNLDRDMPLPRMFLDLPPRLTRVVFDIYRVYRITHYAFRKRHRPLKRHS